LATVFPSSTASSTSRAMLRAAIGTMTVGSTVPVA
jgi:hypothetical protein